MADAILARQLTEQVTRLRQRQTAPLILELDLTDGIGEGPVGDPLSAILWRRKARMQDIVDGLRRAHHDNRVRALVVKVGGGRIGLARMQELREAVGAFRESGKLTVAWSETFGEFTHGNVPYYLATAFDGSTCSRRDRSGSPGLRSSNCSCTTPWPRPASPSRVPNGTSTSRPPTT